MSEDIHKWSDGRYTLMFDEHTFFVWDNEKEERMTALRVTEKLNEQQATISALHEENTSFKESQGKRRAILWWEHYKEKWANAEKELRKLKEENKQLKEKLQSVTMLKDDYEELIESFEKKYGKNIEDVIDV